PRRRRVTIAKLSMSRPKLTIAALILVILLGMVSLADLHMQLFPGIEPAVAPVVARYAGARPEVAEERETKQEEDNLSTSYGLVRMTSTSEEGIALVLLEFDWSYTIDEVEQDIITAMNQVEIADDANDPRFMKFDPSMMGMSQMAITS